MDYSVGEVVRAQCVKTLVEVGASQEICDFYADVLQCEHTMTSAVYRMEKELRDQLNKPDLLHAAALFAFVQNMTKCFHQWRVSVDALSARGMSIPPLVVSQSNVTKSHVFTALCSLETKEVNLHEGEDLTIVHASLPIPNFVRIRNSRGEEGYVPALCCMLATPDNTALTAVERLQIQLVTSWRECVRRVKLLLLTTLNQSIKDITTRWSAITRTNNNNNNNNTHDRLNSRFLRIHEFVTSKKSKTLSMTKLHSALTRLEAELMSISNLDIDDITQTVVNLDRTVLCYQALYRQLRQFRRNLTEAPRPIRCVDRWEDLRASALTQYKYLEMKMTLQETARTEELTQLISPTSDSYLRCRAERQNFVSERMTSISHVERRRFVVDTVLDPRCGERIPLRDAVLAGIVDHRRGLYLNPDSGQGISIAEAMDCGHIKVQHVTLHSSAPLVESNGVVTVRRRLHRSREYCITGVLDAETGERVDLDEARRRNLLDETTGEYIHGISGRRLPLEEAIEDGWVFADAVETETRSLTSYEIRTYLVTDVVDQLYRRAVSFVDAIRRGLIDRHTGDYVNSMTGRRVYVAEAIEKGLLKVKLLDSDGDDGSVDVNLNTLAGQSGERVVEGANHAQQLENAGEKGDTEALTHPNTGDSAQGDNQVLQLENAGEAEVHVKDDTKFLTHPSTRDAAGGENQVQLLETAGIGEVRLNSDVKIPTGKSIANGVNDNDHIQPLESVVQTGMHVSNDVRNSTGGSLPAESAQRNNIQPNDENGADVLSTSSTVNGKLDISEIQRSSPKNSPNRISETVVNGAEPHVENFGNSSRVIDSIDRLNSNEPGTECFECSGHDLGNSANDVQCVVSNATQRPEIPVNHVVDA